jgi:pyruvate dehydrogenase (quinone)
MCRGFLMAKFEQLKDAAEAIIKGEPDRVGVVRKGIMTKAQEIFRVTETR